jgi:hypothetical protein
VQVLAQQKRDWLRPSIAVGVMAVAEKVEASIAA